MVSHMKSISLQDLTFDSVGLYQNAIQKGICSIDTDSLGGLESDCPLPNFPPSFPSVKRIPGTCFIVDGFRFGGPWCTAYFLSHFHSDHYTGLTPLWNKGIIFCSQITARLVMESFNIPQGLIVPLPIGETVRIDLCEVTLVDANHCPGAVQLLFRVPADHGGGCCSRYVHTGDMRYTPTMKAEKALCDFVGADAVFLDTTYCNPKFIFPSQNEVIDYVAETVYKLMYAKEEVSANNEEGNANKEEGSAYKEEGNAGGSDMIGSLTTSSLSRLQGKITDVHKAASSEECADDQSGIGKSEAVERSCKITIEDGTENSVDKHPLEVGCLGKGDISVSKGSSSLFLISTYVIGKEKILLAVAKRCDCLVFVNEKKFSILKCLNLDKDLSVFTTDSSASNVHVVGWNFLGETWPFFRPNFRNMETLLQEGQYERVIGFVPTGWTYEMKKKAFSIRRKGACEIHLVPYSEHSNYEELREYIRYLKPKEVIPTVGMGEGGGEIDSKAVALMRKHFRNLVDETAGKRKFLEAFSLGNAANKETTEEEQLSMVVGHATHSKLTIDECDEEMDIVEEAKRDTEKTNDPTFPPKVVFRRGMRKRKRETQMSQAERPTEPTIQTVSMQGALLELPGSSQVLQKDCAAETSKALNNDKEEAFECHITELKAILPASISKGQIQSLLVKANGDVNAAVCIFFEQEAEKNRGTENEYNECKPSAANFICLKTGSRSPKHSNSKLSPAISHKRKAKGIRAAVAIDKKGLQPSILTFFRKADTQVCSSLATTTTTSTNTTQVGATNNNDVTGAKHPSQKRTMVERSVDDSKKASNSNVSLIDCSSFVEIDFSEKVTRFMSILEGKVSEEHAIKFLTEANEDMSMALDAYYTSLEVSLVQDSLVDSKNRASRTVCTQGLKSFIHTKTALEPCLKKEPPLDSKLDTGNVALCLWKYKPIEHACWSEGEAGPYLHLARTFDLVEQESGRLKTTGMLCNMFRSLLALSPEDVLPAMYLTINKLGPDYENMDLNMGGSSVTSAIEEVTGTPRFRLREMYNNTGDLGDVAQVCRQTQSQLVAPRPLFIQQVFSILKQISKETGSGSVARKKSLVIGLLRASREKETKYIVRTLVQNMRIGATTRTVLTAFAQSVVLHHLGDLTQLKDKMENVKGLLQEASTAIMEAFNFLPNLDSLVPLLIHEGVDAVMKGVKISTGIPVKPMLAKITNGILDVLKCFQEKSFTCEYKYDGQRAQVHVSSDGSIRIFSRNCEETTARFPDVVEIIRVAVNPEIKDSILDAEIVAVDRECGNKIMAFQHLSTRERGGREDKAVKVQNIKVDVCIFAFDLMYADGIPLVKMPLRERRNRLKIVYPRCTPGYFNYAKEITIESHDAKPSSRDTVIKLENFLEESIQSSCEGMMVKALDSDSDYAASKRSDSWLKVKKDYVEGLHDTLDLVPIGAWHGNGRKAGWYSPFLLACYDPDNEEYQSVCRVMSGFTDAFYKEMKEFFSEERILPRKPPYYRTLEEPDLWFTAEAVWEIRGADFTISPVHQSAVGLIHPLRGISMRFPRFIRTRSDKKLEDATTPWEIAHIFNQQAQKVDEKGNDING